MRSIYTLVFTVISSLGIATTAAAITIPNTPNVSFDEITFTLSWSPDGTTDSQSFVDNSNEWNGNITLTPTGDDNGDGIDDQYIVSATLRHIDPDGSSGGLGTQFRVASFVLDTLQSFNIGANIFTPRTAQFTHTTGKFDHFDFSLVRTTHNGPCDAFDTCGVFTLHGKHAAAIPEPSLLGLLGLGLGGLAFASRKRRP